MVGGHGKKLLELGGVYIRLYIRMESTLGWHADGSQSEPWKYILH